MLAVGILDPTKVTRLALRNAASIAGLMIDPPLPAVPLSRLQERVGVRASPSL